MKMIRCLLLALLLAAAPLAAQDETITVDAENNPTDVLNDACTTACNSAACDDDVDEGQGSADGLEVSTTTNGADIIFEFTTPTDNPDPGASAQTIDLVMSRCDDDANCTETDSGGEPPFNAWVTCNGTNQTQIFTSETITAADQLKTASFTFPGPCADDGSDMGVRIQLGRAGGGASRRYACIEAVDWDVTWDPGTARRVIVVNR